MSARHSFLLLRQGTTASFTCLMSFRPSLSVPPVKLIDLIQRNAVGAVAI
jgi:hypothetical protein